MPAKLAGFAGLALPATGIKARTDRGGQRSTGLGNAASPTPNTTLDAGLVVLYLSSAASLSYKANRCRAGDEEVRRGAATNERSELTFL